jgi:catechol 2,3-dioxygenase-like lactoylglutathione lyase family enzyme
MEGAVMLGEKRMTTTIPVSDPARAREFYEGLLEQKVIGEFSDGTTEYEAAGGTGFFAYPTEENAGKSPATLGGWEVENIDSAVRALRDKGITFEKYDLPGLKTENGIAEIAGEKAAWFKDPDGNILTVYEKT